MGWKVWYFLPDWMVQAAVTGIAFLFWTGLRYSIGSYLACVKIVLPMNLTACRNCAMLSTFLVGFWISVARFIVGSFVFYTLGNLLTPGLAPDKLEISQR
jgi:hypothetical protein